MPRIRRCRSSPPRSTGSSTATATSARGWVMRVTASSEPIAEDERRYRVLVDANVVGVTVSDHERVLEANDAWPRITGHTRAEQESGELSWRAMTPPEWVAADDHAMEQVAGEGWVEPDEDENMGPDGLGGAVREGVHAAGRRARAGTDQRRAARQRPAARGGDHHRPHRPPRRRARA